MKHVVSLEYLFAAVFTAIFFVSVGGFSWWWLPLLFLIFDISMIGYLGNARIGALTYNLGHCLVGPIVLLAVFIATGSEVLLFISLLWLFHIFTDRALGYGLKHATGFHHTHLGSIGKAKER